MFYLDLNAPEVYLVLVLFRGYLIAEREPPSQLSCAALDVIRKALSATSAISLVILCDYPTRLFNALDAMFACGVGYALFFIGYILM